MTADADAAATLHETSPATTEGAGSPPAEPRISVIIPAYNEVDSLRTLHEELRVNLDRLGVSYEILFVDDGSTDGSTQVIAELAGMAPHCRALRFHHNQGKAAAYGVAFEQARGQILVTLDADLQDDPAELPKMLEQLEAGYDLVVGWKQGRLQNEPLKKLPSWCYNRIKGWLFKLYLHDSNCGYRVMRAEVGRTVDLYAGNYRFLPELAHRRGFRVTELPVKHRRRKHGKSKYGPGRFLSGLFDLLSLTLLAGFADRPLHFFGSLSLLPLMLGVGLEVYVLLRKLLGGTFQTHIAAIIIGVMLILLGIQLLSIGLIGELVLAQSRLRRRVGPHYYAIANDAPNGSNR